MDSPKFWKYGQLAQVGRSIAAVFIATMSLLYYVVAPVSSHLLGLLYCLISPRSFHQGIYHQRSSLRRATWFVSRLAGAGCVPRFQFRCCRANSNLMCVVSVLSQSLVQIWILGLGEAVCFPHPEIYYSIRCYSN